jgi:hypothetical protein
MSTLIICTVDHSPRGSSSGALIAIHLDTDGELDRRMEKLRTDYPRCNLKAVTS